MDTFDASSGFAALRRNVPSGIAIVVAAKSRTASEVRAAIAAGAADIGGNYVQETESLKRGLGPLAAKVRWHMIGHLQRGKAGKALELFDVIQTVDSLRLAVHIDKKAASSERWSGKRVPVLIEINSGREPQKSGVLPGEAESLAREMAELDNLSLEGLMTMGPSSAGPDDLRTCFRETRRLFEELRSMGIRNTDFSCLSMGMSDSYKAAVEEGSTMVRIGTLLFGRRA